MFPPKSSKKSAECLNLKGKEKLKPFLYLINLKELLDARNKKDNKKIVGASLQLLLTLLQQRLDKDSLFSKWLGSMESVLKILQQADKLKGLDLTKRADIITFLTAIETWGIQLAKVVGKLDNKAGRLIQAVVAVPAGKAKKNETALWAIRILALVGASSFLAVLLGESGDDDDPCTNPNVVEAKKDDSTITNVGSQFPWPEGKGPAPKWDNPKSGKAYGNAVAEHGKGRDPQELLDVANTKKKGDGTLRKNCRQSQFDDDMVIVEAERLTPPCPGLYVIELGRSIGRQFVRGGDVTKPLTGLTRCRSTKRYCLKSGFVADFPGFVVSQLRQGGLSCQARRRRW